MRSNFSTRLAVFAAFVVASIGLAWVPAVRFFRFAYNTGDESYILLVPLISAWMIYRDREKVFADARAGMNGAAGACLVAGAAAVVLAYLTRGDLQLVATAFGLGVLWSGGFLVLFGVKAGRAALFPLLMLLWMLPIPSHILDPLEVALQKASAETVDVMFQALNVSFYREGMVFTLPSVAIEVAKECSGIRSTLTLLLLMMIVVREALRSTWRRLLVLFLTLPVVVLKNGVRIVTLTLGAMYVDPSFLTGDLHHRGGIVFFLVGLAILLPIVGVLRRGEMKASPAGAVRVASTSGA